jgi:hypothetical protein
VFSVSPFRGKAFSVNISNSAHFPRGWNAADLFLRTRVLRRPEFLQHYAHRREHEPVSCGTCRILHFFAAAGSHSTRSGVSRISMMCNFDRLCELY